MDLSLLFCLAMVGMQALGTFTALTSGLLLELNSDDLKPKIEDEDGGRCATSDDSGQSGNSPFLLSWALAAGCPLSARQSGGDPLLRPI